VADEAVETFAVAGTRNHCLDRLQSFIDAEVEEPVVSIVGNAPERELVLQLVRELTGSVGAWLLFANCTFSEAIM
jgi:hypothetical protein